MTEKDIIKKNPVDKDRLPSSNNTDSDKKAVALVIRNPKNDQEIFLVKRPDDPTDVFCGCWGLPAATLEEEESFEEALLRIGQDKLGLIITPRKKISEGEANRVTHLLDMELWEVEAKGQLKLKKEGRPDITYYRDWKWGGVKDMDPAIALGSLCCRMYMDWLVDQGKYNEEEKEEPNDK